MKKKSKLTHVLALEKEFEDKKKSLEKKYKSLHSAKVNKLQKKLDELGKTNLSQKELFAKVKKDNAKKITDIKKSYAKEITLIKKQLSKNSKEAQKYITTLLQKA